MYVGSPGGGKIKVNDIIAPSNPYTYRFDTGTTVTVEVIPSFGYTFHSWTGDLSGTTNPATVMIDCNKSITATFSINWILISAAAVGLVAVFFIAFMAVRRRSV